MLKPELSFPLSGLGLEVDVIVGPATIVVKVVVAAEIGALLVKILVETGNGCLDVEATGLAIVCELDFVCEFSFEVVVVGLGADVDLAVVVT